jgi:hypothetical protein
MASREDRVYNRLDEFGQNQLIQNSFGVAESFNNGNPADTFFNTGTGGGSGGGGGTGAGTTGGGATGGGSVLAFDPYTNPNIQPRVVAFTINTFTNLSKAGVSAKAFLDGVEIENQTISKGRVTFTLNEQRLLNPSTLTLVSGDLRPQKYFIIQCRKDVENEVSIIEVDNIVDASIPVPGTETPLPGGTGGTGFQDTTGGGSSGVTPRGGGGGGAGERFERDFGSGFGREVVVSGDLTDRQNIQ